MSEDKPLPSEEPQPTSLTRFERELITYLREKGRPDFTITLIRAGDRYRIARMNEPEAGAPSFGTGDTFDDAWSA